MSKKAKIIMGVALLLVGLCVIELFGANANRPQPEPSAPIAEVSQHFDIMAAFRDAAIADLSPEYAKVEAEAMYNDKAGNALFVYLIDDKVTSHAKELIEHGGDEDDAWREMKYSLEDYCLETLDKMSADAIPNPHILLWVFNESSYQQYLDSDRDENYSVLYLRDGVPVIDVVFDYVGEIEADSPSESGDITTGMVNALKSAKSYLRVSAFSRNGLVDQLVFEGYTREEARYAVNNCGADWDEQAVKIASRYLSVSSFSRSGLIEQLEFEGFSREQAEYGVDSVY